MGFWISLVDFVTGYETACYAVHFLVVGWVRLPNLRVGRKNLGLILAKSNDNGVNDSFKSKIMRATSQCFCEIGMKQDQTRTSFDGSRMKIDRSDNEISNVMGHDFANKIHSTYGEC